MTVEADGDGRLAAIISIARARKSRDNRLGRSACARLTIDEEGCLCIKQIGANGGVLVEYALDADATEAALDQLVRQRRAFDVAKQRRECTHPSGAVGPARLRERSVCRLCGTVVAPALEPQWEKCRAYPPVVGPTTPCRITDRAGSRVVQVPTNTRLSRIANAPCRRRKGHTGQCRNANREWSTR